MVRILLFTIVFTCAATTGYTILGIANINPLGVHIDRLSQG
jgi:hypothetical protein